MTCCRSPRAHAGRPGGRAGEGRDASGARAGAAVALGARVPLGDALRGDADRLRRGPSLMALPRKVTVIGAGDIGCGWAALCVAAGWPVTLFDASAQGLERAEVEVPQRARALVEQGRASQGIVERGLLEFVQARSLLQAVIDVDELDRAVSLGPALGWAAAGPHLTYHLAAGDGGVTLFLQQLLATFEDWWGQLATWQRLEPEQQRALIHSVERAYKNKLGTLREARDRRLGAILRALEQARTT